MNEDGKSIYAIERERERKGLSNDFTFEEGIAMSFGEKFYRDTYGRV